MRGVNYSPLIYSTVRTQSPPDIFWDNGVTNRAIWARDLPLMTGLTSLNLHANRIVQVGRHLEPHGSLTYLNLSSNLIKVLPDEFQYMKYLETALLFSNLIHSIPDVFHSMTCLVEFNIFNNRLLKIPPTMGKLCNATARSQAPLFLAETRGKGKKGDPLF